MVYWVSDNAIGPGAAMQQARLVVDLSYMLSMMSPVNSSSGSDCDSGRMSENNSPQDGTLSLAC